VTAIVIASSIRLGSASAAFALIRSKFGAPIVLPEGRARTRVEMPSARTTASPRHDPLECGGELQL